MHRPATHPDLKSLTPCLRWSSGLTALSLLLTLGLSACDRRNESGTGSTGNNRTDASPPSTEVEVRTPSAPDSRGGGSSGFKGSKPTADTSGGPTSGSDSPGPSSGVPGNSSAPASASSAPQPGAGTR